MIATETERIVGNNTQNQLQFINPASLSPIKRIVKSPVNPTPDDVDDVFVFVIIVGVYLLRVTLLQSYSLVHRIFVDY